MPVAPRKPGCNPATTSLRARRGVGVSQKRTMRSRSCARSESPKSLLWIDDYEPGLALYKAVFEGFGFRVLTASRGRKGLDLAASHHVDAVVVDYEMPEMDGGEVAASLRYS